MVPYHISTGTLRILKFQYSVVCSNSCNHRNRNIICCYIPHYKMKYQCCENFRWISYELKTESYFYWFFAEQFLVELVVQVTIQGHLIQWTVLQMEAMLLSQAVVIFTWLGSLGRSATWNKWTVFSLIVNNLIKLVWCVIQIAVWKKKKGMVIVSYKMRVHLKKRNAKFPIYILFMFPCLPWVKFCQKNFSFFFSLFFPMGNQQNVSYA